MIQIFDLHEEVHNFAYVLIGGKVQVENHVIF